MTLMKTITGCFVQPLSSFIKDIALVCNLTIKLISQLGARIVWIWMAIRFLFWVTLLSPAFWRTAFVFFMSDYIKRGIKYGPNARNFLDIYLAQHNTRYSLSSANATENKRLPVIIFISGGAWILGYKAWGAFMGMLFAQLGIVFVTPDYRNFPQGTIDDMVEDCGCSIQWVFDNIHQYDGDKDNIYLISQSAGSQITALTILNQAFNIQMANTLSSLLSHFRNCNSEKKNGESNGYKLQNVILEIEEEYKNIVNKSNYYDVQNECWNENDSIWNPFNLKAFVGIAGPYNLVDIEEYLNNRGLYTDILQKIMDNKLEKYSPFYELQNKFLSKSQMPMNLMVEQNLNIENWRSFIPNKFEFKVCPFYLFHGENDSSVPVSVTLAFAELLKEYNVDLSLKIYANKTHTSPIIEDPIAGSDPLVCDILKILYPEQRLTDIVSEVEDRMRGQIRIPQIIIKLAAIVCPF